MKLPEDVRKERELRLVKFIAGVAVFAFMIGALVGMVVAHGWDVQFERYLLAENAALSASVR